VNLSLSTDSVDDVRVLGVAGEVDVYSAPTLREQLAALIDESGGGLIVVDLAATTFIDSTGLGVLVAGHNHAAQGGGSVRIVCAQERILKLFRITGLDDVLSIYPDRAAATETSAG
jgi:anti-sigma B factor antagonist